uniref:Putative product n=1 Tax=Xenopsylla cheopis TaxID=163159 RepID=A0A6M2E1S2_XENCH
MLKSAINNICCFYIFWLVFFLMIVLPYFAITTVRTVAHGPLSSSAISITSTSYLTVYLLSKAEKLLVLNFAKQSTQYTYL